LNKLRYFYLLLFPLFDAAAGTPAEEAMSNAQMPHRILGASNQQVRVHLARVQGFLESDPDHQTHLATLKKTAQHCLANREGNPVPANPPSTWPDYVMSMRKDGYVTANRSITYIRSLSYLFNQVDCSLQEVVGFDAVLSSNSGTCRVDLVNKTAKGMCDAGGHANALPPAAERPLDPDQAAALEKMRSSMSPEMKLMMKKLNSEISGPRPKKVLLGLTCEVWKVFGQPSPAENFCFIFGVPFSVAASAYSGKLPSIELEARSRYGYNLNPVEAQLDVPVSAAIFTPYLASGFTITKAPR